MTREIIESILAVEKKGDVLVEKAQADAVASAKKTDKIIQELQIEHKQQLKTLKETKYQELAARIASAKETTDKKNKTQLSKLAEKTAKHKTKVIKNFLERIIK